MVLLVHCAGCIYYFVARMYGFDSRTWVGINYMEVADKPLWQQYFYSLYWAMTTFATVGYGDLQGTHIGEVGRAGCSWVSGRGMNVGVLQGTHVGEVGRQGGQGGVWLGTPPHLSLVTCFVLHVMFNMAFMFLSTNGCGRILPDPRPLPACLPACTPPATDHV